ncbi:MAG: VWA domain-containing protein [Candidatus Bathyarchaeota archaeon]
MSYLEYARSLSFKKDQIEAKLLIDPKLEKPTLSHDEAGFVMTLPEPAVHEEEEKKTVSFLGYQFLAGSAGKLQVARLFKACVFHLSAHVVVSNFGAYARWEEGKNNRLAKFSESLVEDVKANVYILRRHPDKLVDIAFANSLALKRMKPLRKIWNPATRVMAASLLRANAGVAKGKMGTDEQKTLSQVAHSLEQLKKKVLGSLADDHGNLASVGLEVAGEIYNVSKSYGPILEIPSFPHTEQLGHCTLFPQYQVQTDDDIGDVFHKCLTALGGEASEAESPQTMRQKAVEAEASQVFDSWSRENAKKEKILGKYEEIVSLSRFKSIGFPSEDYTEYLRMKTHTKSSTRRLINSLMVGFDALDEDPRKMYGVVDIQEVIQVIASKTPRVDVFMRDENIGKSYAWIILLDASKSMSPISDDVRNFGICLAETAKELLVDPTSWALYAFNDRFTILKDSTERYGPKNRARIGGLKFEGSTYMPDALQLAGELLKKRAENLRLVTIISDGWPYGYTKISAALTETLNFLRRANIAVIGVGVKSDRMENFFRVNCNVKCMRDLSKAFSRLFLEACRGAVGL